MAASLADKLNDFSLAFASVEWDNLPTVGKVYAIAEECKPLLADKAEAALGKVLRQLLEGLESHIMGENKDKKKAAAKLETLCNRFLEAGESESPGQASGRKKEGKKGKGSADEDKELKEYAAGSMGMFEELEQRLLELEKNGRDKALVNDIFRMVHTLKGETGFAGLAGVAELCHCLESVFALLRDKPVNVDNKSVDTFLQIADIVKKTFELCTVNPQAARVQMFPEQCAALDRLKNDFTSLQDGTAIAVTDDALDITERTIERVDVSTLGDLSIYQDFIQEASEHLEHIEVKILELETRPADSVILNEIFRPLHTIKGVTGFLALRHINKIAHDSETLLDHARSGRLVMDRECIDLVFEVVDVIRRLIHLLDIQIKGQAFADSDYPFVEVLQRKLLSVMQEKVGSGADSGPVLVKGEKKIGEILVENKVVTHDDLAEALDRQRTGDSDKKLGQILIEQEKVTPREMSEALRRQMDTAAHQDSGAVKVGIEKLDHLIEIVGELVISQTLIAQSGFVLSNREPVLSKNVSHLTKIVRDIQYVSMSLRMVPVKATFQKMARLVRDLSGKSGKRVELVITGAETELDKNVVEKINDPLVHMIRNSVDHGIESPDDRIRAGKTATGQITLNAYHQGGNIVIEVKDDGKGLDKEAIRSKAVEKSVIAANANMADEELYQLIFAPGFSTAKVVTDVSGRGVGMDVVKKNIEKLGGTVTIATTAGKGSVFTIRLPLTMAILDGMILQVGGEKYLLPVLSIKESIQPAKKDVVAVIGRGEVVNVRGMLVPLIRLSRIFREPAKFEDPCQAIIILVELQGKTFGLMVDEILGQQQVVIKSLKGEFRNTRGVSGCSILGDGKVGLILDVKGLVEMAGEGPASSRGIIPAAGRRITHSS